MKLTGVHIKLMQADLPVISTELSLGETQETAPEGAISQLGGETLFDKLPAGG